MKDVTLSIVHYRQPELLKRCLAALESLSLPDTWETILVDNSPEVNTAEIVRQRFSWVTLLPSGKNLGFGGGHNLAYTRSRGRYFFVLNPDVLVLPGALETLIRVLDEHPRAGLVGPCLLNPDQTCQHSARRFYDWRTVLARRLPLPGRERISDYHLMKDCDLSDTQPVDWILGAAMAIRRSAFDRPNLFDDRYTLYFEDVDLCYFAQKDGWEVLYCPEAKMIHDHQRASAKGLFSPVLRHHFRSWVKFYLKTKRYQPPDANSRSAGPWTAAPHTDRSPAVQVFDDH
jgi:GT2 family glycosyltransferase